MVMQKDEYHFCDDLFKRQSNFRKMKMNQSVRNRNILTVLNLQTQTLVVIYCQTPVLHNLSLYQKIEQTGEALYYGCSLVGLSVGWLSRWDDSNLGQMKEISGADL